MTRLRWSQAALYVTILVAWELLPAPASSRASSCRR